MNLEHDIEGNEEDSFGSMKKQKVERKNELDLRGPYSKISSRTQAAKDEEIRKSVHEYVIRTLGYTAADHVPYHVGFTGSRGVQDRSGDLRCVLDVLLGHDFYSLHHGDCIGGDFQAHNAAIKCGYSIVIHPPLDDRYRFFGEFTGPLHSVAVLEPKEFLLRNHDIVDESRLLVALPKRAEHLRSGTWATIRYARKLGKPIIIV